MTRFRHWTQKQHSHRFPTAVMKTVGRTKVTVHTGIWQRLIQMFHDKGKHFHTWNQATQIWTSSRQRQVRSGTLVSERGSDEQDWSRTNQSRRQRYKKSGMALQTIGQGTCPQPLQKWTEDAGHMQLEALVHPLHVAPTAQSLLLDFLKSAAASPVPARQKRTHTRPRPNVSRLVTFGRRGSSSLHVPSAIIRY